MNYQSYVENFFYYMYKNFSGLKDIQTIEKNYNTLVKDYPNYYLICDNNKNFLFIKDFHYTSELLDFFSKKIDLNFLGSENICTPMVYHFIKTDYTIKDVCLSVGQNTSVFKKSFDEKFKNYNIFKDYNADSIYTNQSRNEKQCLSVLVLDKIKKSLPDISIDWEKTVEIVFDNYLGLNKYPEQFYLNPNTSLVEGFLNLIIELPMNDLKSKMFLFNYLQMCIGDKIDWNYKAKNNNYLAINFIENMNLNFLNNYNNQQCVDYWIKFFNFIIFKNILPSQFSFDSIYKDNYSLMQFMENHWSDDNFIKDKGILIFNNYYKSVVTKIKIIQEQQLLGQTCINNCNSNLAIRKAKFKV